MNLQGHIFLVGFMGSGKTTVGKLLAETLGLPFVDLDEEIEKQYGRTIAEIFQRSGEEEFRAMEEDALGEVASRPRSVVALGGGTFTRTDNRLLIEEKGVSVWLQIDPETAWKRCRQSGRPLARDYTAFLRLHAERENAYARSDLNFDAAGHSPSEVALLIERQLEDLQNALDQNGSTR